MKNPYKLVYMSEFDDPDTKILGYIPQSEFVAPGNLMKTDIDLYLCIAPADLGNAEFTAAIIKSGDAAEVTEIWRQAWAKPIESPFEEEEEDHEND